jgi:hypothetical protein
MIARAGSASLNSATTQFTPVALVLSLAILSII